ncbi:MAG TPA: diguanylate cyclase [Candidatus Limnocylindrales bacterium]|nr:diguanylate cyclase [Candidatus Limnocylindrales bacterium]
MLLALVFGFVLVLVGVTASALVAVASEHLRSSTLRGVVTRDASLVELFVNGNLRASDVDADGPGPGRAVQLGSLLAGLTDTDEILRIELRGLDGRVLASDDPAAVGEVAGSSAAMTEALAGEPTATVIDRPDEIESVGALDAATVLQEYLPVVDRAEQPIAVVAMWRDATALLASIDAARRDIMIVTLAAGFLLAGVLFLIFRSAQARLSRQHTQLIDATRRDALTEMLNHGAIVALLAEEVEAARLADGRIGVALVDIDNFRLLNDTHGHDAADEVLLLVAELVALEAADGHVARYGPDEFLLVRTGADVPAMEASMERLRTGLEEVSVQFGDSERLPVSVSAGICAYPEHAGSVTELLSAAAVAVSEAKGSGGDTVRVALVGEEERVLSGTLDVLQGLVIAVDNKDRYTKRHSEDVARYAVFLAERIGLDEELRRTIHLAGLLHDIGKIGIPDVVLRKPSKLTADEYGMFQQHVVLGDAIVRDVPNVEVVRAGIRHHHERWDGKGYVEGLEGETIPMIARVLAVADAFSAMTTTRPYRKALPIEEALKRLGDAAGTQLQEELVTAFITGIETAADAPLPGQESPRIWTPQAMVA